MVNFTDVIEPATLLKAPSKPEELSQGAILDTFNTCGDRARARALRKSLQRLADGRAPDDPLREMAREVLSGRVGLREAARIPAYAEALGERMKQGWREFDQLSPEERKNQEAAARTYLWEQKAEIDEERRTRGRAHHD
ncbi:hypothetical protein V2W30_29260 [Streptomyces sp. Q6]|uniref:Uncharacterized protein n=1 Tax=Streptomyces citrinus TaxID=3118173 RepID=A0ACD5AIG2_9ACTN